MSLNVQSNSIKMPNQVTKSDKRYSREISNGSAWVNPNRPKEVSNGLKVGVFSTTLAGVALALAIIMKGKGYSLKPSELFKQPIKNCGLLKTDYKEKEILTLATGSIGGGLIGGYLFDKKENFKAKIREAVIQMVGNVAVPLTCVSLGVKGFRKLEKDFFKNSRIEEKCATKALAGACNIKKTLPITLATIGSLVTGIFLGNKTGNAINEYAFNVKDKRKIKPSDMSPHLDDMCLAISLASEKNIIGHAISRVIPAALMVGGYSTGVVQEKPERLRKTD